MTSNHYCVVDTNVLVSALVFKQTPEQVVSKIIQSGLFLFSDDTLEELIDVLGRPKFSKHISAEIIHDYLSLLANFSRFIKPSQRITACRDPRDNMFLELAVAGKADFIVTGDQDLLELNPFRNVRIVQPAEFMAIVKKE
ncbi:MAG: putative toxin-antitoxin system toxin component, PIN family [Desulfosudaceae bacterium]